MVQFVGQMKQRIDLGRFVMNLTVQTHKEEGDRKTEDEEEETVVVVVGMEGAEVEGEAEVVVARVEVNVVIETIIVVKLRNLEEKNFTIVDLNNRKNLTQNGANIKKNKNWVKRYIILIFQN